MCYESSCDAKMNSLLGREDDSCIVCGLCLRLSSFTAHTHNFESYAAGPPVNGYECDTLREFR